jgi:hypothetical protein
MKRFIFTYLEIGESVMWLSKEEALKTMEEGTSRNPNLYYQEIKFLKSKKTQSTDFAWSEVQIYSFDLEPE